MADEKDTIDAEVVEEKEADKENNEQNSSNNSNDTYEELNKFLKTVDELPLIVKVILALPGIDVFWNIYRLLKSVVKNNTTGIVIAVLILVIGIPFFWVVDIICLALNGHVWWLD